MLKFVKPKRCINYSIYHKQSKHQEIWKHSKYLRSFSYLLIFFMLFTLGQLGFASDLETGINAKFVDKTEINGITLHLTGVVDEGGIDLPEFYASTETPLGQLITGRKVLKQGPGYFNQLMLAESGPALPVILHRQEYRWFKASQLVAFLGEGVNKQLFVHRVANDTLLPGLEIAFSEAMMASEHIHPAYYLTKKLIGIGTIYDDYTDNYIGLDFTYTFTDGTRFYGELLVDEYAQKSWSNNPDERAHLLGVYYPLNRETSLRFEYSNIFNYVYIHKTPQNNYTYQDQLIGHPLGPDNDVFDLEVKRLLREGRSLTVGLRYRRQGIGDLSKDFDGDHSKRFLSTITEEEKLLRLQYSVKGNSHMRTTLELDYGQKDNIYTGQETIFRLQTGVVLSY